MNNDRKEKITIMRLTNRTAKGNMHVRILKCFISIYVNLYVDYIIATK
jgi:hypothetical protein